MPADYAEGLQALRENLSVIPPMLPAHFGARIVQLGT